MSIFNLCAHSVLLDTPTFSCGFGPHTEGGSARCSVKTEVESFYKIGKYVHDIPIVNAPEYTEVVGLPLELDDGENAIIVSMVVGQQIAKNPHLWKGAVFGPDAGPTATRGIDGQIASVRRFILYKGKTIVYEPKFPTKESVGKAEFVPQMK